MEDFVEPSGTAIEEFESLVGQVHQVRITGQVAEVDLDYDRVARFYFAGRLHENLVGVAVGRIAFDHQRTPVLDPGYDLVRDIEHDGIRVDLDDVNTRRVVVAQLDFDVAHVDGVVVGRCARNDRVLHDDDAVALRAHVVGGPQVYVVTVFPVHMVEAQHHGPVRDVKGLSVDYYLAHEIAINIEYAGLEILDRIGRGGETAGQIVIRRQDIGFAHGGAAFGHAARGGGGNPHRIADAVVERLGVFEAVVLLFLPGAGHRHGDVDDFAECQIPAEAHVVVVVLVRSALAHRGKAVDALVDDDQALAVAHDVVVEAVDDEPVVKQVLGADEVVDGARHAFEFARDDVLLDIAGDFDDVGAKAADDAVSHAEGGRLHVELVVAFEAIDLDHLDRAVAHVQPGAVDRLVGDRDVVGEFGGENHELVESGAALDRDRRVDVVAYLVLAAAGTDIGRLRDREIEPDLRARDAFLVERYDVVGVVANGGVEIAEADLAIVVAIENVTAAAVGECGLDGVRMCDADATGIDCVFERRIPVVEAGLQQIQPEGQVSAVDRTTTIPVEIGGRRDIEIERDDIVAGIARRNIYVEEVDPAIVVGIELGHSTQGETRLETVLPGGKVGTFI